MTWRQWPSAPSVHHPWGMHLPWQAPVGDGVHMARPSLYPLTCRAWHQHTVTTPKPPQSPPARAWLVVTWLSRMWWLRCGGMCQMLHAWKQQQLPAEGTPDLRWPLHVWHLHHHCAGTNASIACPSDISWAKAWLSVYQLARRASRLALECHGFTPSADASEGLKTYLDRDIYVSFNGM